MSDKPTTPPDRLSVNPASPHYNEEALERGVGVRFKGVEKTNVDEYCVSEGWVRLSVGKTVDRKGNAMTSSFRARSSPTSRTWPSKVSRQVGERVPGHLPEVAVRIGEIA